jgi:hypothetical protein
MDTTGTVGTVQGDAAFAHEGIDVETLAGIVLTAAETAALWADWQDEKQAEVA